MTMQFEWTRLREWNGSQASAFEELCCQLAAAESAPSGSRFERKGTPDSGVECYWVLPTGEEWGWQAKFFTDLGASQWSQMDNSVRAALKGHPSLCRYVICLPLDLPDARVAGRRSLKEKWERHVEKWESWARKRDMRVTFKFWGTHEMFQRLTREEHAGRLYFWFKTDHLHAAWFDQHLLNVLKDAGDRYTPGANIELPLRDCFDALGRTAAFAERWNRLCRGVEEQLRRYASSVRSNEGRAALTKLGSEMQLVLDMQLCTTPLPVEIPLAEFRKRCTSARSVAFERSSALHSKRRESHPESKRQIADDVGYELSVLNRVGSAIDELASFLESNEAHLANTPAMLLVGEVGTGKTHLLCDVAKQRVDAGLPTILILGEKICESEPWSQIIQILGLTCQKPTELLGALNAAGEAAGVRTLLLIDALNEGEGKRVWSNYLGSMLNEARGYPWLAVAVSVRSSYEELVIPPHLTEDEWIRIEHHGFSGHEYEACQVYFDYFDIELPSVPILNPEFSNPLFLKLFCRGLNARGLTRVPSGLEGFSATFTFFIQAINDKLSAPDELDYDPKEQIVWRAVKAIAERLAATGHDWVQRAEAHKITEAALPSRGYHRSLLKKLLAEGILWEERIVSRDQDNFEEGIRFTYDRLKDFLIAKHLIETVEPNLSPERWFVDDPRLSAIANDGAARWEHRGLLEVFSVLLPETLGRELLELVPESVGGPVLREAFIASLIWRRADSFTDKALELVWDCLQTSSHRDGTLEALLRVATRPNHPLNADFLHRVLSSQSLANRDAWWSTFLHYEHGEHGPIDAFLAWAWSPGPKPELDDETARLAGTALSWFFTTSNRFLRDRATKALACLLQHKLGVYAALMDQFCDTNDPYVLERVMAAAFGSAMRCSQNADVAELAAHVYRTFFDPGPPPVHILTREYAKGIIDCARHRGSALTIDEEQIRPPFDANPADEPPSKEQLSEEYDRGDYGRIRHSVLDDFGDFSNYVIGSIFGHGPWTAWKLDEEIPPTRFERSEAFHSSLSGPQKEAWNRLESLYSDAQSLAAAVYFGREDNPLAGLGQEKVKVLLREAEIQLRAQIDEDQLVELDEAAIPEMARTAETPPEFDVDLARRWIFNRVITLGWTPELFAEFDRGLPYDGRSEHKAERMGKKYQWIALHELLARVCDNYVCVPDWYRPRPEPYQGTWQLSHARDIDPSLSVKATTRQRYSYSPCWWAPSVYDPRGVDEDMEWLKGVSDWPELHTFFEVSRQKEETDWLALHTYLPWDEPGSTQRSDDALPWRKSYLMAEAYLVRLDHLDEVLAWAKARHFWGRWMPESVDFCHVHLGEYPWAAAYQNGFEDTQTKEGWTQGYERADGRIPRPILVASNCYLCESSTQDCSIDESVSIHVPCRWLMEKMNLRWSGKEGEYQDADGRVVALDPSVAEVGPGSLLLAKQPLFEFLAAERLSIFWILLGEKMVVTGLHSPDDYKGHLEVSGVGWLDQGAFRYELRPVFRKPEKPAPTRKGFKKKTARRVTKTTTTAKKKPASKKETKKLAKKKR